MKSHNTAILASIVMAIGASLVPELAHSADAGGNAFPDQIMVRLGAFSVFDSSTGFSASGDAHIGTSIDFERDLNGDTTITSPRLEFYYRFTDKHRIELSALQLKRDGHRSLTNSITFNDRTYTVDTQVNSSIKNNSYKVAYAYSFYHVDKVELSISAGLNFLQYKVELESIDGVAEAASVSAPLPVFGFQMDYAVTPRLIARIRTDAFYFDFEDKIRGSLVEFEAGLEYRALRNLAIGASLARLSIDTDIVDDNFSGSVSDFYRGARLYGVLYF